MNPTILNFLQEIVGRWAKKSPKFFKWWQRISLGLTLVSGVPWVLKSFNIDLPPTIEPLASKFFTGVGAGLFLMSQMPVQNHPVGQTTVGKPIVVIDEKKLPFSAKVEEKEVQEQVPQPPVMENVPENPIDDKT
jgi:hypothetical protein